ncbi:MAG: DUF4293 domain-containing protein [Bacteroidia bacterium]
MIQRIQSVYLFVSAAAVAIMFFLPMYIAQLNGAELQVGITGAELKSEDSIIESVSHIYVPIIAGITMLLSIVTIFLFNNRPLQTKLARLGTLLYTGLLVALLFLAVDGARAMPNAVALAENNEVMGNYQVGAFLPIVGMVLSFLAGRAIMKDEAKVRSASRLR